MDFSQRGSQDQALLNRIIDEKQQKEFMKTYAEMVERCFTTCVQDFTSQKLTSKEDGCINNCTIRSLKVAERLGARFGEINSEMMEKAARGETP